MHTAGQTEAGQTQVADLKAELSQAQSLNAKLEEDLLAAERVGSHMSKAGNGQVSGDESQPGFNGECGSAIGPRHDVRVMHCIVEELMQQCIQTTLFFHCYSAVQFYLVIVMPKHQMSITCMKVCTAILLYIIGCI